MVGGYQLASPSLDCLKYVVRAAIHPAIGVARVGNSQHDFFIGPELVGGRIPADGAAHDETGALRRQAARFRLYGYDCNGTPVCELTSAIASIRWKVHLCNKKASWYRFLLPMDIPEASEIRAERRNPHITGCDRAALILDSGEQSVRGANALPVTCCASVGSGGDPCVLGELRTDHAGRLLVLGGFGRAWSPEGRPIWDGVLGDYPSGDGWYDDISDGTVSAEIVIDGVSIDVKGAWVVVAPPNYAPELTGIRTMYDALVDIYTRAGWMHMPERASFTYDIYPIFQRLSALQWVNYGFAVQFGKGGVHDFASAAYVQRLSDSGKRNREFRRQLLQLFRPPDSVDRNPTQWPWLYGDAFQLQAPGGGSRQFSNISGRQWAILKLWAEGEFEQDSNLPDASGLEHLPLGEQPAMLDRSALDYCLADALRPGYELTWPMRHLSFYEEPFRIRRRSSSLPEPDYGSCLTQQIALAPDGPLHSQSPGDLTRWLAVPWQISATLCRSGYDAEYDPYVPTFWPARVPNHVLSEDSYRLATNPALPRDIRVSAFQDRKTWNGTNGPLTVQMLQMVSDFGEMGVVQRRDGVRGDPDLPETIYVEMTSSKPIVGDDVRVVGSHAQSRAQASELQYALHRAMQEAEDREQSEWQSANEDAG